MSRGRRCWHKFLCFIIAAQVTVTAGSCLFLLATIAQRCTERKTFAAEVDYASALSKAQEAFLVQSGLQNGISRTGAEIHKIATRYVPASVIDPGLAVGLAIRKKRIDTNPLPSPVIPNARHVLTFTPDSVLVLTIWRF